MGIMNSEINIREMRSPDLIQAIDFWRGMEGIGMGSGDNPEELSKFLACNPGLNFVAFDGSELVGAVLCGQDGRRGFINHLAVAKTHRKRGLGENMVNHCLEALRELGIHKCHIFVFRDNQPAIEFWKRTGWEQRHDLIVMSRRI